MEGRVLCVGVSPHPYKGKGYWYLDEEGVTQAGDFVWVKMGRHDTEQMAFVDCVRWFAVENLPYPYEKLRKILRQTTEEEKQTAKKAWADFYSK